MKQIKTYARNGLLDDKLQQCMMIKLEGPDPDSESESNAYQELLQNAVEMYFQDPRKVGTVYGLDTQRHME